VLPGQGLETMDPADQSSVIRTQPHYIDERTTWVYLLIVHFFLPRSVSEWHIGRLLLPGTSYTIHLPGQPPIASLPVLLHMDDVRGKGSTVTPGPVN
jgi:hypothetical protein